MPVLVSIQFGRVVLRYKPDPAAEALATIELTLEEATILAEAIRETVAGVKAERERVEAIRPREITAVLWEW